MFSAEDFDCSCFNKTAQPKENFIRSSFSGTIISVFVEHFQWHFVNNCARREFSFAPGSGNRWDPIASSHAAT